MYSNIVVGTDGSDTAKTALQHAIDLATVQGATIHIVSAFRSGGAAVKVGTQAEHWYIDSRTKIDAILDNAAAVARSKGLTVETHAVEGDPGDAIVTIAGEVDADAVVVGNKGMRGAKRFLLGSVPNTVAHNAPCTVVIVKTT
ncbi:MAG: universal stress protein [Desertimonas sp.]|nr:universal stress protein [Desertimonas sp.]